jgi:DNA-binding NtrC family response regulator
MHTIIVISSDDCFREIGSLGIARDNYEVKDFDDPRRAIKWFSENPSKVQALISGAMLHNIKVSDLIKEIRSISADLPILIIDSLGVLSLKTLEDDFKNITCLTGSADLFKINSFLGRACPEYESGPDFFQSISLV